MPKRRRNGRVWCRPLICGQRYEVRPVRAGECPCSETDCDHMHEAEACTVWAETLVAVQEDLSEERQINAFAHEVFGHALLDAYGIDDLLREKLGLSDEQWSAFDEAFASRVVPALLATLRTNGWLRLPPVPKRRKGP